MLVEYMDSDWTEKKDGLLLTAKAIARLVIFLSWFPELEFLEGSIKKAR